MLPLVWLLAASAAFAQGLPAGQIIDRVTCAADASQSYALFVPADYTPSRSWPVIFAFDPGGRGRVPVERYHAAAGQYGYIVVGSNNSRNGGTEFPKVLAALTNDVAARLAVDPKRVYLAGMSGGARTALGVALASKQIAGVIASSAGYPDNNVRKTLSFPLFATAGTDDFNHLEMRKLDRALTSPHRLVIFNGGHVWLSSELAMQAIEWMELHAMKAGLKPRNDAEIDRLFASRTAAAATGERQRHVSCAAGNRRGFPGAEGRVHVRPKGRGTWSATKAFERRSTRNATRIAGRKWFFAKWRRWRPASPRMNGAGRSTNFARSGWTCRRRRKIPRTRRTGSSLGECSRR